MTLGAKSGEPLGRFLAAAAVLPPAMAGQLLARIAVSVEVQHVGQVPSFKRLFGASKRWSS